MVRSLLLRFLMLSCMVTAMLQAQAQGWMKKYSPDMMMAINTVYPASGNGYLVTGWNLPNDNTLRQRILRVDAGGDVLWSSDIDSIYSLTGSALTRDHGLLIMGVGVPDHIHNTPCSLVRVDSNGHKLWLRPLHSDWSMFNISGNMDIDTTDDGGYICIYSALDTSGGNTAPHIYLTRLDSTGSVLWDSTFMVSSPLPIGYFVRNSGDGGFVAVMGQSSTSGLQLVKVDGNGATQWQYQPSSLSYVFPAIARDGTILLTRAGIGGANAGTGYLTRLDLAGTELWSHSYTLPDSMSWYGQAIENADNTFTLVGVKSGLRDKFSICRVDTAGHILSYKRIFTSNLGNVSAFYTTQSKTTAPAPGGGIVFGGWIQSDPAGYSGFLIRADSAGQVYPSTIHGTIYADDNSNCIREAGEIALPPASITFRNAADVFTVVAGDSAFYSLSLDTGTYSIEVTPPSPYWQPSACTPSAISLAAGTDTTVSFGVTPLVSGPYIVINGHLGRQVLCRPTVYTVQYCNTGTAPFTGRVEIDIDTLLRVDSASIPWTSHTGSSYAFTVDTLGIMECATIEVYCTVPCSSDYLRRTACINAQAFEDTIINPSALWDQSNLRMTADYNTSTDSITFHLKNEGWGPMSGPQNLIVIEDNVILITIPVQLPAGVVFTKQVKANGSTWRASVPQTDYNPYSTFATAAIEGAGTNPQGGISTGFLTQYPYNGYTSYIYNTCAAIFGAYDPNEKSVTPHGAGTDHLIDTNVVPEYTIDFQNTGTDTAYTVRITDTLASCLDPSTIRLEISSHPCHMQLSGKNLVTFTFDNILLPDSGANYQRSMGFVKFRIHQKAGNVPGTVINNKAGIYFDYNKPVITNTATLRIGSVFVTGIQALYSRPLAITASPNPFTDMTSIAVGGESFRSMTLSVYDMTGRLVRTQEAKVTDHFLLDHQGLDSGTYLFRITGDGSLIGTGKMIAE